VVEVLPAPKAPTVTVTEVVGPLAGSAAGKVWTRGVATTVVPPGTAYGKVAGVPPSSPVTTHVTVTDEVAPKPPTMNPSRKAVAPGRVGAKDTTTLALFAEPVVTRTSLRDGA